MGQTRRQLYERARALGIAGRSKMNKSELVAAVTRAEVRRQLYERARALGIAGRSRMNKSELVAAVTRAELRLLLGSPPAAVPQGDLVADGVVGTVQLRKEVSSIRPRPAVHALDPLSDELAPGRSKMNKSELVAAVTRAELRLLLESPPAAAIPRGALGADVVVGTVQLREEVSSSRAQPTVRAVEPLSDELVRKYLSPDTTPAAFAVRRAVWVAPAFLVLATLVSALLAPTFARLTTWYAHALAAVSGVDAARLLEGSASISFRPLLATLVVLLSFFTVGSWSQRARLAAFVVAVYTPTILFVDVVLARAPFGWMPAPLSPIGGIVAAFAGIIVFVVTLFTRCKLPAGVKVRTRQVARRRPFPVTTACVLGAAALVALYSYFRQKYFDELSIRFVGGVDSVFVLFLLALTCLLVFASACYRERKPTRGPLLSVAFVIPARNEADEIESTIRAIDDAAARYAGSCHLYVVDNGSLDETGRVAESALAACRSVVGEVLECPIPGKSHALNLALSHVQADLIVRVDADTLVAPSVLEGLVPWFWDPTVGGVSGLPLPKKNAPAWLYPLRLIEVYYGVAFLRVAQSAANGAMVMPGLIAAYRRETLEELGGFGEGFNGEDADITMRIGRLGYRIVTDPGVRVMTEVPNTLAHLREQRTRWARGLFHMGSRNMSSIWMRQGVRGTVILPWSIFNAARRSLMIPILLSVLAIELVEPSLFSLREVSTVAGFIVGLQLLIIAVLLTVHRQFAALPFIPMYGLFRLFRAYIAFETVLTLRLKPPVPSALRVPHAVRRAVPAWAAVAAVALLPVLLDSANPPLRTHAVSAPRPAIAAVDAAADPLDASLVASPTPVSAAVEGAELAVIVEIPKLSGEIAAPLVAVFVRGPSTVDTGSPGTYCVTGSPGSVVAASLMLDGEPLGIAREGECVTEVITAGVHLLTVEAVGALDSTAVSSLSITAQAVAYARPRSVDAASDVAS